MEQVFLYSYLKYQKENNKTKWKNLKIIPWYLKSLILISIIILISSFVLLFNDLKTYGLIAEMIALAIIIVAYLLSENFMILQSDVKLNNYISSRKELKNWLNDINIKNEDSIKLLINRLKESISKKEEIKKTSAARWDKWMQVLIIPIILSILTTIIASQKDINQIIAYVLSILLMCGSFYGIFFILKTIYNTFFNRRLAQMHFFVDDLQSILDMEKIESLNSNTDEKNIQA